MNFIQVNWIGKGVVTNQINWRYWSRVHGTFCIKIFGILHSLIVSVSSLQLQANYTLMDEKELIINHLRVSMLWIKFISRKGDFCAITFWIRGTIQELWFNVHCSSLALYLIIWLINGVEFLQAKYLVHRQLVQRPFNSTFILDNHLIGC